MAPGTDLLPFPICRAVWHGVNRVNDENRFRDAYHLSWEWPEPLTLMYLCGHRRLASWSGTGSPTKWSVVGASAFLSVLGQASLSTKDQNTVHTVSLDLQSWVYSSIFVAEELPSILSILQTGSTPIFPSTMNALTVCGEALHFPDQIVGCANFPDWPTQQRYKLSGCKLESMPM